MQLCRLGEMALLYGVVHTAPGLAANYKDFLYPYKSYFFSLNFLSSFDLDVVRHVIHVVLHLVDCAALAGSSRLGYIRCIGFQ